MEWAGYLDGRQVSLAKLENIAYQIIDLWRKKYEAV
jgi:hypothetical protein